MKRKCDENVRNCILLTCCVGLMWHLMKYYDSKGAIKKNLKKREQSHLCWASRISPFHASSARCVKVRWKTRWRWSCTAGWPQRRSCCSFPRKPLPVPSAPGACRRDAAGCPPRSWERPGRAERNNRHCCKRHNVWKLERISNSPVMIGMNFNSWQIVQNLSS